VKYFIAKSTLAETNSWFCGIVTTLEKQFENFEKFKKIIWGCLQMTYSQEVPFVETGWVPFRTPY
jgi:hypothetical protein